MEVRRVSRYEFSLRQEVLMEKGASVLGNLFHYEQEKKLTGQNHPVRVMYDLVWTAKRDILLASSEKDLDRIEGQFDLAKGFLSRVEAGLNV